MSLETFDDSGNVGSDDVLGDLFYPLYERLFDENSGFVSETADKLAEARMSYTVEMYLSRALGIGVISGVFLWILGMGLGYGIAAAGLLPENFGVYVPPDLLPLFESLKVPALILGAGLFFGTIGFGLGFGSLVAVPYSRSASRKREINMLLSDSVSFMYALSVGGLNQLEILEAIAKAEDTYGEVAREFQSIVQETEYFDTDYRTAIRNQAMETPSDELSQFLTDMLSIINSGGDMQSFLYDKKEKHMRTTKQQQELTLETLELFGEMYMTLSLFPLLLIIILVIMQMVGQAQNEMLYATVYGLIPLTGAGFLVLVSTVKQDEPGDGYLDPADVDDRIKKAQTGGGLLNLGLIDEFTGEYGVFDRIKNREGTHKTIGVLKAPHLYFRDHPMYTLAFTVPIAGAALGWLVFLGWAPLSWERFQQLPVWATVSWIYVPLYITLVPLAFFREWNVRSRRGITNDLSDNLRKLASANDTGQTILESLQTVSDTSTGKLPTEFETMYAKVNYGMSLKEAMVEFNNKYHVPRLARTIKLISKAQEASSQITDVLTTAAQASENQDDIERERKSRTRMQLVIIIMTYVTLLAVMAILKTQFLDVMASLTAGGGGGGGAGGGFGGSVDVGLLSLLFFHAVTLQAIMSGLIGGYMREADIFAGLKFVVILLTVALVTWILVGGTGTEEEGTEALLVLAAGYPGWRHDGGPLADVRLADVLAGLSVVAMAASGALAVWSFA